MGAAILPACRWWRQQHRRESAARCRAARSAGRWDELRDLARRWSAWDAQNADPWLFLAEVADHAGDRPAVAKYLQRIPDTDAKSLPALVKLMKLQFGPLNEPLEGAAVCERILRREPRVAEAHAQLIRFYALSLQRAKLLEQIRAAIRADREPPEAYVYYFLVDTYRLGSGVPLNERWLESAPEAEVFQVARVLH